MAFKFEKLIVWQKSVELSYQIHLIAIHFPKQETYVLGSQIRRAADSVSLNIAEGSTGQSNAEFKRFLGIALRSVVEIVGCLYLGRKRLIISEQQFLTVYTLCEELLVMINGLKRSLT